MEPSDRPYQLNHSRPCCSCKRCRICEGVHQTAPLYMQGKILRWLPMLRSRGIILRWIFTLYISSPPAQATLHNRAQAKQNDRSRADPIGWISISLPYSFYLTYYMRRNVLALRPTELFELLCFYIVSSGIILKKENKNKKINKHSFATNVNEYNKI